MNTGVALSPACATLGAAVSDTEREDGDGAGSGVGAVKDTEVASLLSERSLTARAGGHEADPAEAHDVVVDALVVVVTGAARLRTSI